MGISHSTLECCQQAVYRYFRDYCGIMLHAWGQSAKDVREDGGTYMVYIKEREIGKKRYDV